MQNSSLKKQCTKPGTFSQPKRLKKGSGFLILCYFFVQVAIAFLFCSSPFRFYVDFTITLLLKVLCKEFHYTSRDQPLINICRNSVTPIHFIACIFYFINGSLQKLLHILRPRYAIIDIRILN